MPSFTSDSRPGRPSGPSPMPDFSNRPSSIPELAERAFGNLWDASKDLRHWLLVAERARDSGKEYITKGDFENAFIQFARAAHLILDKIPQHKEYNARLNPQQKESLTLHGKTILKNLSQLKPTLAARHEEWKSTQPQQQPPEKPPSVYARGLTPADTERWIPEPEKPGRIILEPRRLEKRQPSGINDTLRQSSTSPEAARTEERTRIEQDRTEQRQRAGELDPRNLRDPYLGSRPSGLSSTPYGSAYEAVLRPEPPPIIPLENPLRYEADTDTERTGGELARGRRNADRSPAPSHFGSVTPIPITTTSAPPPTFSTIEYPQLMSHHQRTQGYAPSLQSMFLQPLMKGTPSSLLFDHGASLLYENMLPAPSQAAAANDRPSPHISGLPPPSQGYPTWPQQPSAQPYPSVPPPRPPLPEPPTVPPHPSPYKMPIPQHRPPPPAPVPELPKRDRDPVSGELRIVKVPRDTLSRFISIASLNTIQNRETCGLLLGRTQGNVYIVTTLLIPKQRSTSDTCAMEEEELVLSFSEQRSLITLGWIHTHPTQSCFMSSVDLHTHSGFQRMLPEAFAIVCAPTSTPNFGIFRLTDPPGLQTILSCREKEAFHPHPDVPIYTDADKGHVQMKDMSLEIVDLR